MALNYSCFVSYCHDDGALMKQFMQQLEEALKAYLGPYMTLKIAIDHDRLQPGYNFNEALAETICESVCMIVVYVPRYEESDYCLREFTAMEQLAEKRIAQLGTEADPKQGFIIPVILRGDRAELPARIASHIHYVDFTNFTTASLEIMKDAQAVSQVERIAKVIAGLRRKLMKIDLEGCHNCRQFQIPPKTAVNWSTTTAPEFPFR